MAFTTNTFSLSSITIRRRKRADFAHGLVGCPCVEDRTVQAPSTTVVVAGSREGGGQ